MKCQVNLPENQDSKYVTYEVMKSKEGIYAARGEPAFRFITLHNGYIFITLFCSITRVEPAAETWKNYMFVKLNEELCVNFIGEKA